MIEDSMSMTEELDKLTRSTNSRIVYILRGMSLSTPFSRRVRVSVANLLSRLWEARRCYGIDSRATYAAKYRLCVELMSLRARTYVDDRLSEWRGACDAMLSAGVASLDAQFAAQSPLRCNGVPASVEDARNIVVFRYDISLYKRHIAREASVVAPMIRELDAGDLECPRWQGSFLYCVTEDGRLRVFQRPLTSTEVASGAWYKGIRIKHPMLVYDRGLAVRVAGDLWLEQANGRIVAAVLSRASGHYLPGLCSVKSMIEAARTVLRLRDDGDVVVIGGRHATGPVIPGFQ